MVGLLGSRSLSVQLRCRPSAVAPLWSEGQGNPLKVPFKGFFKGSFKGNCGSGGVIGFRAQA